MALTTGDVTVADTGAITHATGDFTAQWTLFVVLMQMTEATMSSVQIPGVPPLAALTNSTYTQVIASTADELKAKVAAVRNIAAMANAYGGWMYSQLRNYATAYIENSVDHSLQQYDPGGGLVSTVGPITDKFLRIV